MIDAGEHFRNGCAVRDPVARGEGGEGCLSERQVQGCSYRVFGFGRA